MSVNFGRGNTERYYKVLNDPLLNISGSHTWLVCSTFEKYETTNNQYLIATGGYQAANAYCLLQNPGNANGMQYSFNTGTVPITPGRILNAPCLNFGRRNGTSLQVGYADVGRNPDIMVSTSVTKSGASNPTGDLLIGVNASLTATSYFSGVLSWVALLNVALTDQQIKDLAGRRDTLMVDYAANVVELWDFDTAAATITGKVAGLVATRQGSNWPRDLISNPLPTDVATPFPARPGPVTDSTLLLSTLRGMPNASWLKVNANTLGSVATPLAYRVAVGGQNPTAIIEEWGGGSWDFTRSKFYIWGGGHAGYPGNEVYSFDLNNLEWARNCLPSDMTNGGSGATYNAVDGYLNAPCAVHPYDNSEFLPIIDRHVSPGSGNFNTGNEYEIIGGVNTGPYLLDVSTLDSNKVAGTTGSNAKHTDPSDIEGTQSWQNRDWLVNALGYFAELNATTGVTAYDLNAGNDVILARSRSGSGTAGNLWRTEYNDLGDATQDFITLIGLQWVSNSPQSAGGYCPRRKLFVFLNSDTSYPIAFWNLNPATRTSQIDVRINSGTGFTDFQTWYNNLKTNQNIDINKLGMQYDSKRENFIVWSGGLDIWRITPPDSGTSSGWIFEQETVSSATSPNYTVTNGILGKWKYMPGYDACIGIMDNDTNKGDVWLYKPFDWEDPGQESIIPTTPAEISLSGLDATIRSSVAIRCDAVDIGLASFPAKIKMTASIIAVPGTISLSGVPSYVNSILSVLSGVGEFLFSSVQASIIMDAGLVKGVRITLNSRSTLQPVGTVSGCVVRWWDSVSAEGAPLFIDNDATISDGVLSIDLDGATSLPVDGLGYLVISKQNGTPAEDLHFAGRVPIVDITDMG